MDRIFLQKLAQVVESTVDSTLLHLLEIERIFLQKPAQVVDSTVDSTLLYLLEIEWIFIQKLAQVVDSRQYIRLNPFSSIRDRTDIPSETSSGSRQ